MTIVEINKEKKSKKNINIRHVGKKESQNKIIYDQKILRGGVLLFVTAILLTDMIITFINKIFIH